MARPGRALARRTMLLGATLAAVGGGACAGTGGITVTSARTAQETATPPAPARQSVPAPAPPPKPPPPAVTRAALIRAIDGVHRRYAGAIFGACFGAIDENASAIRCYGRMRPGSSRRPGPGTLFQIGSISKTVTGTLLALRASTGAVKLSDPVRNYVPVPAAAARLPASMTLLDLADHYSGLPRDTPIDNLGSITDVDRYFTIAGNCAATPGCMVAPPGRAYLYSNFGYGLLGELLALHDGYHDTTYSAWEQDATTNVTGPLGMPDTRSWMGWRATAPAAFDARRARAVSPPNLPYFPPAPFADAAAGLYSSSNDMLRWLSFSMGLSGTPALNAARPLLYGTPKLIRSRVQPPSPRISIGVGWHIDTRVRGRSVTRCVSKNGLTRGFTAHMVFVSQARRGVFVLLNNEPDSPSTAELGTALVNALPVAASRRRAPRPVCPVPLLSSS